jgi:hypothetical protein
MHFDQDQFNINEDYEKDWTKTYSKERVKREYETKKRNNGNVSPPPYIIEKENFVHVFNQLNLPSSTSSSSSPSSSPSSSSSSLYSSSSSNSSSSSSSNSSSSSSSSKSSNYSINFIISTPLTSAALAYSLQANLIIDVDNNNEDAIDRLLKVRDKVPMYKDNNSIIYAVLSQLNPLKWGGDTLAHTYDTYYLLNNYNLQDYLEQFRVNDKNSTGAYNVDNGLYIGRGGLGPISTRFGKLIMCFETGAVFVTKKTKKTYKTRFIIFSQYE